MEEDEEESEREFVESKLRIIIEKTLKMENEIKMVLRRKIE